MRANKPILPADLTFIVEDFQKRLDFAKTVGNSLHVDVIDNQFVQGEGLPVDQWPLIDLDYVEAHLMVKHPLNYLSAVKQKGVTRAIIHVEASFDLAELVSRAKALDLLLGFAVNLDTDLGMLKPFLEVTNYVQVMGIIPGRTGQRQDPQTALGVSYLHKWPNKRLTITVDGGVTTENIPRLKQLGADYFVASSAIYDHGDWQANYQQLLAAAEDRVTQPVHSNDH